jgi:hypothetical protein
MKQYTYYQLHINKLFCSMPYRNTDNSSRKGTQNVWSYRRMVKVKSHLSRCHCNKTITRQAMSAYRNTEASSRNHCCRGKATNITYSECVSVALVIQKAKRMRRIIFSSVDCLVLPCFSPTLSQYMAGFSGKGYWTLNCVAIFFTTFVWIISHSKENSARHYHTCT